MSPSEEFKPENVRVYKPGEPEYEHSVATPNLLYRFTRPPGVVRPKTTDQIKAILNEAYEKGVSLTIKDGGHCYAGFSTTEKGVLVDLMNMNQVDLKLDSSNIPKTVTLAGGAKWGHAYRELVNGRHDRYMINGGRCPTVGVSGFVLGGGLGPFGRSLGMGCDSIKAITIAIGPRGDGPGARAQTWKVSRDDADANKRELFWALCGAGGGNFGIVTEVEMNVQCLNSEKVTAGRLTYRPKQENMGEFMDAMCEFYTAQWSNEMTIDTSWLCDLSQTDSELAVRFISYYNGSKCKFDNEIDQTLVIGAEVGNMLKRRTSAEHSTRFLHETLVSQWSEETIQSLPSSRNYSIYTSFVFTNGNTDQMKKIVSVIRHEMKSFRAKFAGERGLLQVSFIHSGGVAADKASGYTAYPWRDGIYHTYIMLVWEEKWLRDDMENFLDKFKKRLRPYSIDRKAAFINFPDNRLKDGYLEAYYGENVKRLQSAKANWDPKNFWNWEQGISPSQDQSSSSVAVSAGKKDASEDTKEDRQWNLVSCPQAIDFEGAISLPLGKVLGGGIHSLSDLGF
ncbi:hypothetical protein Asppvi_005839 [Aspergillus pseudoviridinutans]|uniref:FAD-binding PCMH-type domain-containing protein n=1 Tax=Aspergillus pseudoviridinutans TaxID=1517512 RepID=A0A9P3BCR4_9EURO|nr:uncharacterized protein Asppvi_005839 [Aspergillus pseudoviridinutans]GIJ86940.1 hypothetical protein Asppvi_005839 [Aspergillus pseudoviridinutans]